MDTLQKNADRFQGFAALYNEARPKAPEKAKDILLQYLGQAPQCMVDLGCGTGLSSMLWCDVSEQVIGVEPSTDMLQQAIIAASEYSNIRFVNRFSDDTGLPDNSVDLITCSQSFHWMDPQKTLAEVDRLLKHNGVFAVYDCDWPPVTLWEAEQAYEELMDAVEALETEHASLRNRFLRWDKNKHLDNLREMGHFRYTREVVFSNKELCDAGRFVAIALSQGGVQATLKAGFPAFVDQVNAFTTRIHALFGSRTMEILFCYKMRLGIK